MEQTHKFSSKAANTKDSIFILISASIHSVVLKNKLTITGNKKCNLSQSYCSQIDCLLPLNLTAWLESLLYI